MRGPTMVLVFVVAACGGKPDPTAEPGPADDAAPSEDSGAQTAPAGAVADVEAVTITGEAGAFTFGVTVRSPDTGCDRYANWWELLDEDGTLIYRRILAHSHVDEQPFARTGGPVEIDGDTTVIVRAHMHPGGYGGAALRGSASGSFAKADDLPANFAADLATTAPLPTGCTH